MTIQQLSKEVGIGLDTLRIWERRYGFPRPERDGVGHRCYPQDQVEELRLVKTLQSLGQRPGQVFALDPAQRRALLQQLLLRQEPVAAELEALITSGTPEQIGLELGSRLRQLGLSEFIHQVAVPLVGLLDRGWSEGRTSVAREHLVSDGLEGVLRQALAAPVEGTGEGEAILFLTLSGERHKLGLLMAAALFHALGSRCRVLNDDLPLSEVAPLAAELRVAAVALSFSSHYPTRRAKQDLASLRRQLDRRIKLIAGGAALRGGVSLQGLVVCNDLRQIPTLYQRHLARVGR